VFTYWLGLGSIKTKNNYKLVLKLKKFKNLKNQKQDFLNFRNLKLKITVTSFWKSTTGKH
jgi:hypothetical protein